MRIINITIHRLKRIAISLLVTAIAFSGLVPAFAPITNIAHAADATSTPATSTISTTTYKVFIDKFIDGSHANASSSQNMSFNMFANYNSTSTGSGSGNYMLTATSSDASSTPYQAMTLGITNGGSYSTNEVIGGNTVQTCPVTSGTSTNATSTTGTTTMFTLAGYTYGDTYSQAVAMTPSMTSPNFTNLQANKYVIVWNTTCATNGTIGGTVGGGTTSTGVLAVTSIDTINNSGTANGSFDSGWKYTFNITVPTNETHLAMKFADWMTTSSTTMPVSNNLRISSLQADNANAKVMITGANTYSTPTLNITQDLDPNTPGLQIKVLVETAIPTNTVNGNYTTSYSVKTN